LCEPKILLLSVVHLFAEQRKEAVTLGLSIEASERRMGRICRLEAYQSTKISQYAYVRFACDRGFQRVATVQNPRPYGSTRYYYLARAGERLLRA